MLFNQDANQSKIDQLLQRDRELRAEIQLKFTELGVTPEELEQFLSNPAHFTEEEWAVMEEQRKAIDQRLECSLANVPNPEKTKKAYRAQRVKANWIPMK